MKPRTLSAVFAVARTGSLSDPEVRLWLYVRSWQVHGGKDTGAARDDASTARDLGWSERKVQRVRASLMDKGYLRQRLRGPALALYWAVTPEEEASPRMANQEGQSLAKNGETGGNDSPHDSPPVSPHDSPSVSPLVREYGSTEVPLSNESVHTEAFDELWRTNPSGPRKPAREAYLKAVEGGGPPEDIARRWAAYVSGQKSSGLNVGHLANWLAREGWADSSLDRSEDIWDRPGRPLFPLTESEKLQLTESEKKKQDPAPPTLRGPEGAEAVRRSWPEEIVRLAESKRMGGPL